jgi:hypothetical protein
MRVKSNSTAMVGSHLMTGNRTKGKLDSLVSSICAFLAAALADLGSLLFVSSDRRAFCKRPPRLLPGMLSGVARLC